jgi:hypothetical protein
MYFFKEDDRDNGSAAETSPILSVLVILAIEALWSGVVVIAGRLWLR